jgi:hypothetical protein
MRDRPNDQHRTRTAAEIGRSLGPDEVVDHVDEDKTNNARENRRVMGRGAHTSMHNRQRRTSLPALKKALSMDKRGEKLY